MRCISPLVSAPPGIIVMCSTTSCTVYFHGLRIPPNLTVLDQVDGLNETIGNLTSQLGSVTSYTEDLNGTQALMDSIDVDGIRAQINNVSADVSSYTSSLNTTEICLQLSCFVWIMSRAGID